MAEARHAALVEIPENGYTSLNPPLGPERGDVLTLRSTDPLTIARFNSTLETVDLSVRLSDPYMTVTKGELVKRAPSQVCTSSRWAALRLSPAASWTAAATRTATPIIIAVPVFLAS